MERDEAIAFARIAEVCAQGAHIFGDAAESARGNENVVRAMQACDAIASVLAMLSQACVSLAQRVECEGIADA